MGSLALHNVCDSVVFHSRIGHFHLYSSTYIAYNFLLRWKKKRKKIEKKNLYKKKKIFLVWFYGLTTIGMMVRVFDNGLEDLGSIPG